MAAGYGSTAHSMSGRNGAKSFAAQQPSGSILKERSDGIRLLLPTEMVALGLKRGGKGVWGCIAVYILTQTHKVSFHADKLV